jgi:hypothetical protein
MTVNKAFLGFGVIFALYALIAILMGYSSAAVYIHPLFWYLQVYFLLLSLLTHWISHKGTQKKDEFHNYYMGSMTLRFLISLITLFVLVWQVQENPFAMVGNFFMLYLGYTGFEIYVLLLNLRADSKNHEHS